MCGRLGSFSRSAVEKWPEARLGLTDLHLKNTEDMNDLVFVRDREISRTFGVSWPVS